MLLEKDLMKRDLQRLAGISSTSIAKLGKGENVNTDILVKICKAMDCDTADIMEIERIPQEGAEGGH
jgi:DNA-binding Xre family transcriptional regulator